MWMVLILEVFCLVLGLMPWAFASLGAPGPENTPAEALRIFAFAVGAGALLPVYLALFVSPHKFWSRQAGVHSLPGWAKVVLLVFFMPVGLWIRHNPHAAFAIVPTAGSFLLFYSLVLRFKFCSDAG
jgi:hypothetical protein